MCERDLHICTRSVGLVCLDNISLKISPKIIFASAHLFCHSKISALGVNKVNDHHSAREIRMPRLTKKQKESGRAKKEAPKKAPNNKGFKVLPARAPRDAYLGKGEHQHL